MNLIKYLIKGLAKNINEKINNSNNIFISPSKYFASKKVNDLVGSSIINTHYFSNVCRNYYFSGELDSILNKDKSISEKLAQKENKQ